MTVEDMRDPNAAEAFRERQAARPEAVPNDIERQNKRSVLRSEKAAAATEPAGDAGVPDPVRDVIQSTGQPLDDGIQQAMEERMGDSFGDVQIHADATAANACEEINARAFTVGNHIAFNHGEYDPESPKGQHILAHELAHVRQQTGADISMMPQDDSGLAIDPDPQLEREAEDAAQQALADGPVTINRMGSEMQIQRVKSGAEAVAASNAQEITDLKQQVGEIRKTINGNQQDIQEVTGLKETVSQNQREIQDTQSNLSALEDEVRSGFGEKAKGIMKGGAVAGTIALGRAVSEPAIQDVLKETATNPQVAAPAIAAAVMTAGVATANEGLKSAFGGIRDRLFSADDDADGKREDGGETDDSSMKFW
ncbi:eCIS core domain-containing protein [Natrinema altunense]